MTQPTRPTTPPAPGTPTYTPPSPSSTPPHVAALQAAVDAAGGISLVVARSGLATLYCGKGGSLPVTLHDAREAA